MGSIDRSSKRIAIIGSGCAGLGAAWALKDTEYDVHIFEKNGRLGGHTNTQPFRSSAGETIPVDTGFIVMNAATYPNFLRFLKEVNVDIVPTEMTFGVSRDGGKFEWSGEAQGIFAQRRNIFRLSHWRLIFDIIRFNQFALDLLMDDDDQPIDSPHSNPQYRKFAADVTIGRYLDLEGYSKSFRDDYLIPMTAAVWSTSPDKASLDFPARTLIRFMWNHHLLSTLAARPPWLTIPGGSQKYVDAVLKSFPSDRLHLHMSSPVASVSTKGGSRGLSEVRWNDTTTSSVNSHTFDHVIFACHGDEVLPVLQRGEHATSNSKSSSGFDLVKTQQIFQNFQTSENKCYLHSDLSLMPQHRACWTAWNYLTTTIPSGKSNSADVSLTYCMNILQHYPEEKFGPVLVTMNPPHPPKPSLTQGEYVYQHPLYTPSVIDAQKRLEQIQGRGSIGYCGAWTKYGFHEDGFSSGLRVAIQQLGAKLPFEFVDSTFSRGHRPTLCWQDHVVRVILLILTVVIRGLGRLAQLPVISTIVSLAAGLMLVLLEFAEKQGLLKDAA
ncbi:FAD/NAD(P)-binding domain-containing protein [Polychaeton citri CBS 116435]|uniref:FAD/NAD(P)-binding domain-containing protein n=1 Tax=Polychaeton citri CBS 116435 TaxID=1314669 RepID=A0A9P4Q2B0_9PEZI|nr:FAD/NAD(P)-binding domain-containing protein [Polychaeton citri CBS 116435]